MRMRPPYRLLTRKNLGVGPDMRPPRFQATCMMAEMVSNTMAVMVIGVFYQWGGEGIKDKTYKELNKIEFYPCLIEHAMLRVEC